MFGNAVTDFSQHVDGTNGYVLRVDLSELDVYLIEEITPYDDGEMGDGVSSPSPLSSIMSYGEDSDCPDCGYYFDGHSLVYIFLKSSAYPYTGNTRIGIIGKSFAKRLYEYLDVPPAHIDLFMYIVMKKAAELLGRKVPYEIESQITNLKAEL